MDRDGIMWVVSAYFRDQTGGPGAWVAGHDGRMRFYFEDGRVGESSDPAALLASIEQMADQPPEDLG